MPPPDPYQGGVPGLLGNLFPGNNAAALYQGLLSDPATQQQMNQRALQAMAGSFAQSAMPTRMPTPFGAVLGQAAAAVGPAQDAVMQARLQEAQGEQERAIASLTTQKVNVLGGMGQHQAALDAALAGSTPGPMVPGTLGAPIVQTQSHDAGQGWMPGYMIPDGAPTATPDPKKSGSENLNSLAQAAAPMALPEGYTVKKISGYRPGAEVGGGGGPSQHAKDNAADFQIFRPDGTPIDNKGPDTTDLYGKLALTMYHIASPDIKPWLAWGGNFSTRADTDTRDLMHFDYAGDRGRFGSLAQMEQQWLAANQPPGGKPPQVASIGPTAGLLNQQPGAGPTPPAAAGPAGPVPPGPAPGAPPGLLGPSGRTIAQLADQARADAGGPVAPPPPLAGGPGSVSPPPGGAPPGLLGPPPGAGALPPGPQPPPVPPIAQPQLAPGGGGTVPGAPSPAAVAAARQVERDYIMMQLPVPANVSEVAKFPLIGPTAQAQAAGTAAGQLPSQMTLEAFKAQQTAAWNLFVKQNEPILTRPNTLSYDQQSGRFIGNVETLGPDGNIHRYLFRPDGQKIDLGAAQISPYAQSGQKAVADKNAEDMATTNKNASAAQQALTSATNMRQEAPNFYTGVGADYNQALNKVLLAIHPDNPDLANKVASYEAFIKDAGLYARQQAQAASQRTGVQELKFVASSTPSEETTPKGLDRVLSQIQGISDYQLAKQQAMNAFVNQPGRGGWDNNGFEAQFNAAVSPYAFMYRRYSDQDRAEMVTKLAKTKEGRTDLMHLQSQLKYIDDNNLVPR